MIAASEFLDLCHARGIGFITGTPCSYLKPLINAAIDDPRFTFRDAVNEGDAVAMAAGAALGGTRSLVMFQNSGLGNAVNTLTSLCYPFQGPVLMVVTHRGEPGGEHDEPQHEQMGRITTDLLETMDIGWARLPQDAAAASAALDAALDEMTTRERPFAFVMSKDAVAPQKLRTTLPDVVPETRTINVIERLGRKPSERMSRTDALKAIVAAREPSEVLVATTGYTGRELYALGDDPWNIYMVGSMGSASAFALGLAMQRPERRVTAIEGDGAVLMRMGNLATIGAYAPASFMHVVLDNEAHDSTGGQATVSRGVSFAAVAQASGYRRVVSCDEPAELSRALAAPRVDGPTLVHLRIKPGAPKDLPRPAVTPAQVFRRLRDWLDGRRATPVA
jgi:phosphonopyruvate decarboxylase